jgi:hypothetical protein
MADKKNNGLTHPNVFNETTGGSGPEDFDDSGAGVYHSWDEIQAVHLTTHSCITSNNVDEGYGIMGGPASGEPNPLGYSGTSEGGTVGTKK